MSLLDMLLNAQGGGAVRQLSQQFGLSDDQTQSAIAGLLPALTGAMRQNAQGGGIENLMGMLGGGQEQYFDNPQMLGPEVIPQGNGILGQLLGSPDVSRALAGQVSRQTGIGESVLKSMLPMVATLAVGALAKNAGGAAGLGSAFGAGAGAPGGGSAGGLMSLLDSNNDGSVMDDILGMASKFLQR